MWRRLRVTVRETICGRLKRDEGETRGTGAVSGKRHRRRRNLVAVACVNIKPEMFTGVTCIMRHFFGAATRSAAAGARLRENALVWRRKLLGAAVPYLGVPWLAFGEEAAYRHLGKYHASLTCNPRQKAVLM
jgi:hypothetical protein